MQVQREVLLQDLCAVLPVHPVKVVPHYDSGVGRPWSEWKGVLIFVSIPGEVDLIDLREMLIIFINHGGMLQNTTFPCNFIVYGSFFEYPINVHFDNIGAIFLL